jgi:hypothetical protein
MRAQPEHGPPRCAVLAHALDEPLAGTAPVAPRWVCVEHRGAWPREVGAHPEPAVRDLALRVGAAGWRLLLIRRPGRQPGADEAGPGRVYLADTTPPHPRVTSVDVPAAELADVPLPAAGAGLPGIPVAEPMLLVCTHGRRDRCCALDGRALVAAVAPGCPDVWEASHLGGHRFAPTALVLPTGYLYGRLDRTTAVAARKAAGHGEVEPALCRGRSTWSRAAQVAELAVREAVGLRDAAALTVEERPGSNEVDVLAADGRRWAVPVRRVAVRGARPTSCGAAAEPVEALRAVAVHPVGPSALSSRAPFALTRHVDAPREHRQRA